MICTFCHEPTKASEELKCYCCRKDLPCLTHKDKNHPNEDYGGVRQLDRGEWNDEGYFCDWCEARLCGECAVDCEECDMWVCKRCRDIMEQHDKEIICSYCYQQDPDNEWEDIMYK